MASDSAVTMSAGISTVISRRQGFISSEGCVSVVLVSVVKRLPSEMMEVRHDRLGSQPGSGIDKPTRIPHTSDSGCDKADCPAHAATLQCKRAARAGQTRGNEGSGLTQNYATTGSALCWQLLFRPIQSSGSGNGAVLDIRGSFGRASRRRTISSIQ